MLQIKLIQPEMTYNIRHRVLRPNQSIEDSKYESDHEEGSFHVGAFMDDKLVSVVSFCLEKYPDFPEEVQYRLRAMATLEDYRMLGAGRLAVRFAEEIIIDKGAYLLWCKGRTSVQKYYENLGFKAFDEAFDYPPIGSHIIMYKRLI
jgi:GNAT superfamily N-acetyltransferase